MFGPSNRTPSPPPSPPIILVLHENPTLDKKIFLRIRLPEGTKQYAVNGREIDYSQEGYPS